MCKRKLLRRICHLFASPTAAFEEDPVRESLIIRFYQDQKSEWRWAARTANGREVANSGEGYTHKDDCERIAQALFPVTDTYTYEVRFQWPA